MNPTWIPNALSMGNFFFGFTAMLAALRGRFDLAVLFIFVSMVLDMFDGRVARLIKRDNPLGKDLDSFADLLSFGVVPGVIFYAAFFGKLPLPGYHVVPDTNWHHLLVGAYAFLFPLLAAIRLARFNVGIQTKGFSGCPSPVAGGTAIFLIAFNKVPGFFLGSGGFLEPFNFTISWQVMGILFLGIGLLMVIPVPFAKVQLFSSRSFRTPLQALLNLLLLAALVLFFKFTLLLMMIVYVGASLYKGIFTRRGGGA